MRYAAAWAGIDTGSGLRHYEVQVKAQGEVEWSPWLTETSQTSAPFRGQPGQSYLFRVRATDNVNNISDWVESGPVEIVGVTKYYHFGARRVAMRQGDVVYYLSGDHLGSVSLTTDSAGMVVAESRYLPYGQVRWSSGAAVTDFGFTGQRNDSFGLMDYKARYYDPYLGRFVSADTVVPEPGNPQDFNKYGYVRNNPLINTDPSGQCIPGVNCPGDNNDEVGGFVPDKGDEEPAPEMFFEFGVPSRGPIDQELADNYTKAATVFDLLALSISVPPALANWGITAASSTTGPQDGLAAYLLIDGATKVSPLGIAEDILGVAGLAATAASDYYAGNTYQTPEGLVIGQDTYVSASLAVAGLIPDVTTDLGVNVVSFTYNVENMFPDGPPGLDLHSLLPGNLYIGRGPVLRPLPTEPDL